MTRILIVVGSLVALGAALLSGCGKKPDSVGGEQSKSTRKVEPWESATARLRTDTDHAGCKTALTQLNSDLAERPDLPPPPGLDEAGIAKLKTLMPLMADETREIKGSSYSSLDPAYLADCFLFRDAARSIDPTGKPPAEAAKLAFAWVCRQVVLQPWEVPGLGTWPAVPPSSVLARGSGSGLERAYVFLSVLQQLGLDGCLLGDAGKAIINAKGEREPGNGPFWGVGVRVGADVLAFNPWSSEPFSAPDGAGVATFAQIKADPAKWKLPDPVKSSSIVLVAPLSAMAPRMAALEAKIGADTGVKVAIDPAALKSRFPAEAKFWNPEGDRFTYSRVQIMFLPLEEGGLDRLDAASGPAPYVMFKQSLLPKSVLDLPEDLSAGVAERLRLAILGVYGESFVAPPTPRERIQRGQLQDAARDLTRKLQAFGIGLERVQQVETGQVAAWKRAAAAEFEKVTAARFPNPGQTTAQPDNDPAVVEAKAEFDVFWRTSEPVWRVLVDRATASIGRNEAAYLLALAKHEEAERRQTRGEPALDAWNEAANAWAAFLEQDSAAQPARTAQAKSLAARAKQMAK